MNVLRVLAGQHSQVNYLFSVVDYADRQVVTEAIIKMLTTHAKVEEEIFYPALREKEATADLVSHAVEEHQVVKNLLDEWSKAETNSDDWRRLKEEIKLNVSHHVKEEEDVMFPKVKEAFTVAELEELGVKVQEATDERI